MRWTVTVFVVKLLARNARPSTQKTPVFAAAPSVSPGTATPGPDALSRAEARGGRRRTSAWMGIVGTARGRAGADNAPRQPRRGTSHAPNGMQMGRARAPPSGPIDRARARPVQGDPPENAPKAGPETRPPGPEP